MEVKKPVSTLQSIQQEIAQKKKAKRRAAIRRVLKWVFIVIAGFLLAFIVFLYDKSDYSKILNVHVENNQIVSDQEVIDEIGFEMGSSFYSFLSSSLEKNVPESSFIESIEVQKHWFNQAMTIHVTEKKVIGYRIVDFDGLIAQMIASDGSLRAIYEGELSLLQDLARFSRFEDEAALSELVDGISRTDPILYSNISEIIREPKSYDENYLKVLMADGVILYTSIYSLENLDAYTFTDIYNRLEDNRKCLVYDVFWRSMYAKPCQENE